MMEKFISIKFRKKEDERLKNKLNSKQKIEIMALIGKLGYEIGGQKGPIGRDRLKNGKIIF